MNGWMNEWSQRELKPRGRGEVMTHEEGEWGVCEEGEQCLLSEDLRGTPVRERLVFV